MSTNLLPTSRRHILTVNLEDYFQVGSLSGVVSQKYWDRFDTRVEQNTLATLDLLDKHGAKATFFTVGWIADQAREVVAEVARRGHEIASKGYLHRSIAQMSPEEFREDAVRSRVALERACGHEVRGYRIARGWFTKRDLWALDILAAEGFLYDSSLRPIGRVNGLDPQERVLHRCRTKHADIWALPTSSWWACGFSLPISGGNYMRQLPHGFIRRRLEAWDRSVDAPLILYFHVWELDPDQPRIGAAPWLERVRHYRNLERMRDRIDYYLSRYSVTRASDFLDLQLKPVTPKPDCATVDVLPIAASSVREEITIVVPCFNEVSSLPFLKRTLALFEKNHSHQYKMFFVFVDDGSTDQTFEHLSKAFGARDNCDVVRHARNRGVAAATMTGIRQSRTEKVCVIDCDCSYDIGHLARFVPLLEDGVDLVTASPYHRDGDVLNVPSWRISLSRGASLLYRLVLNTRLATYTACFRVYRRSAVVNLQIANESFLGITEILALMDLQGLRIVECPAVLEPRLFGQSKMKVLLTIVGHLRLLRKLALRSALGRGRRPVVPGLASPDRYHAPGWSVGGAPQGTIAAGPTDVFELRSQSHAEEWRR
jgi:polysaccharide deacetylase family protein (PEP-CTERM system associated)